MDSRLEAGLSHQQGQSTPEMHEYQSRDPFAFSFLHRPPRNQEVQVETIDDIGVPSTQPNSTRRNHLHASAHSRQHGHHAPPIPMYPIHHRNYTAQYPVPAPVIHASERRRSRRRSPSPVRRRSRRYSPSPTPRRRSAVPHPRSPSRDYSPRPARRARRISPRHLPSSPVYSPTSPQLSARYSRSRGRSPSSPSPRGYVPERNYPHASHRHHSPSVSSRHSVFPHTIQPAIMPVQVLSPVQPIVLMPRRARSRSRSTQSPSRHPQRSMESLSSPQHYSRSPSRGRARSRSRSRQHSNTPSRLSRKSRSSHSYSNRGHSQKHAPENSRSPIEPRIIRNLEEYPPSTHLVNSKPSQSSIGNTGVSVVHESPIPAPHASHQSEEGLSIPTPQSEKPSQTDNRNVMEYPRPLSRASDHKAIVDFADFRARVTHIIQVIIEQFYVACLLRLPAMYWSRVDRIFNDASLTLEEIKEMALQSSAEDDKRFQDEVLALGYYYYPETTHLPPSYQRLKMGWENFIDSLTREWKTFNIISALLLSGILTIFQLDGASSDPVTRYLAFWSLISALLSLLYGCIFIIRFSSMRKAYKAAEWALEAQKHQNILWNVWIMLAMPLVWLSWSILTYIVCIMSFMWRVPANFSEDIQFRASPETEFGFRIFICITLGLGVFYGLLIINTLRRYGTEMDEKWKTRIAAFKQTASHLPPLPEYYSSPPPTVIIRSSPLGSHRRRRGSESYYDDLGHRVATTQMDKTRGPATPAPHIHSYSPSMSSKRPPPLRSRDDSPITSNHKGRYPWSVTSIYKEVFLSDSPSHNSLAGQEDGPLIHDIPAPITHSVDPQPSSSKSRSRLSQSHRSSPRRKSPIPIIIPTPITHLIGSQSDISLSHSHQSQTPQSRGRSRSPCRSRSPYSVCNRQPPLEPIEQFDTVISTPIIELQPSSHSTIQPLRHTRSSKPIDWIYHTSNQSLKTSSGSSHKGSEPDPRQNENMVPENMSMTSGLMLIS